MLSKPTWLRGKTAAEGGLEGVAVAIMDEQVLKNGVWVGSLEGGFQTGQELRLDKGAKTQESPPEGNQKWSKLI